MAGEGNLEQFFYNIFLFGGEVLSAGSRVQSPVQLFLIGYARNIKWQVDKTTPCLSDKTTWRVDKMTWQMALRNRDLKKHLLVNANLSVNQMSPIICRWKLVKHFHYFGDNRRAKGIRKIKLCALKVCCLNQLQHFS